MSTPKFEVGDRVTYEMWDGEEGRGYGWSLVSKASTVVSIYYKMANGDFVEEKKLVNVESKSELPNTNKNGDESGSTG